jgi:hypothetical protein
MQVASVVGLFFSPEIAKLVPFTETYARAEKLLDE